MAMTPYPYYAPMHVAGYPHPMAMQQHAMMAAPMMMPHQLQATPFYAQQARPVMLPPPSATFQYKERAFTLHNIANGALLDVDMDGLKHSVMKHKTMPGQYRVEYFPVGDEHRVSAKYNGVDIPGTPFNLIPKAIKVTNHPNEKMFTIENVHDPDSLVVNSKTLKFQVFKDKEKPTTYHALYQPEGGVHDVRVKYKGKVSPEGTFRLAPRNPPPQLQQMVPQMMMVPQMVAAPAAHMLMAPAPGAVGGHQLQAMMPAAQMFPVAPMHFQGNMLATQQPQLIMPGQAMMMPQQMNAAPVGASAATVDAFQPIMMHGPPTFGTPIHG